MQRVKPLCQINIPPTEKIQSEIFLLPKAATATSNQIGLKVKI